MKRGTFVPRFFADLSLKNWRCVAIAQDMIVNNGIRAREVRLIGQDGEQLGIKSKREALQLAEEANLDLVLVAPKARPAVARIMDYGSTVSRCKRKSVKLVRSKRR